MLVQQEGNILSNCKKEGFTFIGWTDGNTSKYSKFEWICNKGHKNITMAKSFLKVDHRCDICNFGYFRKNSNTLDNLYLTKLVSKKTGEDFIKIGRTFDISKRLDDFKEVGYTATILSRVRAKHKTIYKLEQQYHEALKEYQYIPTINFVGWSECYNENVLIKLTVISTDIFYINN